MNVFLSSLPTGFKEMLCLPSGCCHVMCFLSEKSQGIVSDILSGCDRVAGQEDVISVCLFCPVMEEAREGCSLAPRLGARS